MKIYKCIFPSNMCKTLNSTCFSKTETSISFQIIQVSSDFFQAFCFHPHQVLPQATWRHHPLGSLTGGPHQLVPFKREQIFKVDAFGTGEHVVAFGRVVSCDTMKPLASQPTSFPPEIRPFFRAWLDHWFPLIWPSETLCLRWVWRGGVGWPAIKKYDTIMRSRKAQGIGY